MSSAISKKTATPDSDEIDLGRLYGEILDHRKLIIILTIIITLVAVTYALFATPVYQATAMIQIEQKKGNAILDSISKMLPDSQPVSEPEIALLQSRMILGKTVDDLNLQAVITQNYFPVFGRGWARMTGEIPGKLSISRLYIPKTSNDVPNITLTVIDKHRFRVEGDNFKLDGEVGTLITQDGIALNVQSMDAEPGTQFTVNYITRLDAINGLSSALTVDEQGKDTGILNLSFNSDDRALATSVLNDIGQNYLDQNIARQAAQDAKSLEFLNQQLPLVRSELNDAEDRLNLYRRQKDSVDLSLEAKSVLEQIVNVDSQLNELTFREAEVSQLYTKNHPTYKALLEKRQTLRHERDSLNKRVTAMPATQQEVESLSRDVDSGRAIYMQLLNRQQELSIAKSSAIGNVRIIDNAITQPKPVKPRKTLVVLIGIVAGLFVSFALVLLKVFVRRGIESPEQLEEVGVSVYASVPLSEWLNKKNKSGSTKRRGGRKIQSEMKFLAVENPADLAIEAIRSLRTSLHFAMMEARNNILMISGASQNAGKTFIASNLAAAISQSGKKVLFIDADMRRGYSHKLFRFTGEQGLSDILSGRIKINEIEKHVPEIGFDFISRGKIPPNPSELLMQKRLISILDWASDNYDFVIIDTPPILAVTDAAIIGRCVGTSLLVARYGANTVKEVEVSIRRFEQVGIQIKGCILNGVLKKASSYYGYGYSQYDYFYADKKGK
ncbi:polysaccharide biosynthesis tyrosine autokinase [Rahnella woolbedingensis]|uniref:Polysaccharide biosynthesis tyrosine autokinase n=1 Tax=Rahnella woolbedingensis TaxID=1510574 RepID=A0A419N2Q5_9GAMM|nr:polysaccharide biosynthesis tyrosine autokinase [Rahnella woolbedingensis]RJT35162.1 polysaccharide biosynthesis tyrosine autokinase [Rahnella woolbedingensis]